MGKVTFLGPVKADDPMLTEGPFLFIPFRPSRLSPVPETQVQDGNGSGVVDLSEESKLFDTAPSSEGNEDRAES